MWGNLVTETAFAYNFTFGFPTKQSDILLHLTHWQYWFWFWFTYYMVMYYFIFLRLIRYRVLKMSPKLATSFRSHGKWGDLLVCFIPISWCTNILSNSNFILRMIEWQSESSLFTLRVRGKQWYWIYKVELKSLSDVASTSVNVGNNFWINKSSANKHHYLRFTQVKHNLAGNYDKWYASGRKQNTPTSVLVNGLVSASASSNPNMLSVAATPSPTLIGVQAPNWYYCKQSYAWRTVGGLPSTTYSTNNVMLSSSTVNQSTYVPDVTRTGKVRTHTYTPVRLMKNSTASKLKLSYNSASSFAQKPASSNFYFVVKQKRYIPTNFEMNKYSLGEGRHLAKANFNSNDTHLLTQHCASRSALPNLQANRRLLRTRRVLVLPAHTNITLITNSFDVMHSWYIPGLGVKLDCVPGRSTHHTIHIDHAGFYYGQCAEICGRYHHHMPIRVCALPFEHFLIWWYHYGVPFFMAGNQDRKPLIQSSAKHINW